jgi:hypothetical protein
VKPHDGADRHAASADVNGPRIGTAWISVALGASGGASGAASTAASTPASTATSAGALDASTGHAEGATDGDGGGGGAAVRSEPHAAMAQITKTRTLPTKTLRFAALFARWEQQTRTYPATARRSRRGAR